MSRIEDIKRIIDIVTDVSKSISSTEVRQQVERQLLELVKVLVEYGKMELTKKGEDDNVEDDDM
jgi:hypothetical protein